MILLTLASMEPYDPQGEEPDADVPIEGIDPADHRSGPSFGQLIDSDLDGYFDADHGGPDCVPGLVSAPAKVNIETGAIARIELLVDQPVVAVPGVATSAPAARPARVRRGGPSVGRILLNSGVTALSFTMGGLAVWNLTQAREAFDDYLTVESDRFANRIYEQEVKPRRSLAVAEGVIGGVAAGAAAVLWIKTDF